MVKHVYGWEISNQLEKKHKVHVRSFSSAKVKCMKDYIKPCIREEQPDTSFYTLGQTIFLPNKMRNEVGCVPGSSPAAVT